MHGDDPRVTRTSGRRRRPRAGTAAARCRCRASRRSTLTATSRFSGVLPACHTVANPPRASGAPVRQAGDLRMVHAATTPTIVASGLARDEPFATTLVIGDQIVSLPLVVADHDSERLRRLARGPDRQVRGRARAARRPDPRGRVGRRLPPARPRSGRPARLTSSSTCWSTSPASTRPTRRRSGSPTTQARENPDEAMHEIVERFGRLAERFEVIVVWARTTPTSPPAPSCPFNAKIAANLGSPVVLVVHGRDAYAGADPGGRRESRSPSCGANHAQTVAVIANRVDAGRLDAIRAALARPGRRGGRGDRRRTRCCRRRRSGPWSRRPTPSWCWARTPGWTASRSG